MKKPVIGFIGLGIMGAPMAFNLIQAGCDLRVWNRSSGKAQTLSAAGAHVCATATEVVSNVDVLILMLSDARACDDVMFDDAAVVPLMKAEATVVVMSSIPVQSAIDQGQRCAAYGVHYLDAPVSGGEAGAIQATLAIMVGGSEEHFNAARSILNLMGHAVRVGPVGTGQLAKLANQLIVATTIATVAEALLLVQSGGADPVRVREALRGGLADSPILRLHGERMIKGDFAPGGRAKWQVKDLRAALDVAARAGLTLPVSTLVGEMFEDMVENGDGELDHSGLVRELRRRNGLQV